MPISKAYTLPFLLLPLALAVVVWLICAHFSSMEAPIFERLLLAARLAPQTAVVSASGLNWSELLILYVGAVLSVWSGFRLGTLPRVFVGVQLFLALLIVQFFVFSLSGLVGSPIACGLTVVAGIAIGTLLKRFLVDIPARFESQYYELVVHNRELLEARVQLVRQDEVERRMLAADLHDQVLNDLKAVKQKIAESGSTSDSQLSEEIDRHLTQAMQQVREVMESLCPSVLEHLGLVAAVEDCLRRGAERGGLKIRFKSKVDDHEKLAALSLVEQSLLFRLVQESVTNVCKHAQASTLKGAVELEGDRLRLLIEDDGTGMDLTKLECDSRGLQYMRLRADLIGATISWRAGEGEKGTAVEINLDLAGRSDGSSADH